MSDYAPEADRYFHVVSHAAQVENLRHSLDTIAGRCREFAEHNLELRVENSRLKAEIERLRKQLSEPAA